MVQYFDSQSRSIKLGKRIGSGGEAILYAVQNQPQSVAKIWRSSDPARAVKLQAALRNTPGNLDKYRSQAWIVWPTSAIKDDQGTVVGYVMPFVDHDRFHESQHFFNPLARQELGKRHGLHIPDITLTTAARNIALAATILHSAGHVIGDVNEKNILIDLLGNVALVDIDSIQIQERSTKQVYRCTVARPEFLSPRLQGKNLRDVDRTVEDDNFGIPIVIFKLLFDGRHPYQSRLDPNDPNQIQDLADKIKDNLFPYNEDNTVPDEYKIKIPEYQRTWELLRTDLKALFQRTYDPFYTQFQRRPTAQDWVAALDREIRLFNINTPQTSPTTPPTPPLTTPSYQPNLAHNRPTTSLPKPKQPIHRKAVAFYRSHPRISLAALAALILLTIVYLLPGADRIPQKNNVLFTAGLITLGFLYLLTKPRFSSLATDSTIRYRRSVTRAWKSSPPKSRWPRLLAVTSPILIALPLLSCAAFLLITPIPAHHSATNDKPAANGAPQYEQAPKLAILPPHRLNELIAQYASCNNQYADDQSTLRAERLTKSLRTDPSTAKQLESLVNQQCPPDIPATTQTHTVSIRPIAVTEQPHSAAPKRAPTITPHVQEVPQTATPPVIDRAPTTPHPTIIHLATSTPIPTPNAFQIMRGYSPSHIHSMLQEQHLDKSLQHEIKGCYQDPHAPKQRRWLLFTQPDGDLSKPTFAVHATQPTTLINGACYSMKARYVGHTNWRACASEPYGANCTPSSSDFHWDHEIPAFMSDLSQIQPLIKPDNP